MSLTKIIQIFFCHTNIAVTNRVRIFKKTKITSALSRTFASFAIDIRDLSSDYLDTLKFKNNRWLTEAGCSGHFPKRVRDKET